MKHHIYRLPLLIILIFAAVTTTACDNEPPPCTEGGVQHLRQSQTLYQQASYEQALIEINQAINCNPDLGTAYYVRGLVHRALDKRTEAIADFRKVLTTSSDPELNQRNQEMLLIMLSGK